MADRPAIELEPGYPPEAMYSKPISYEATIKSRRKNKVHSLGNASIYKYTGNKNLVFQMGSNDSAVDFLASFIQFTLRTKGFSATSLNDYRRYLASGGLHSLFRTCEITSLSNASIERKNNYNSTAAFFQKLYQNPKQLDGAQFIEGASLGTEPYNWEELGNDGFSYKCLGVSDLRVEGNYSVGTGSAAGTAAGTLNGATEVAIADARILATSHVSMVRVLASWPSAVALPWTFSTTAGTGFSVKSGTGDVGTFDYVVTNVTDQIHMSLTQALELVPGDDIVIRHPTAFNVLHKAIVTAVSAQTVTFSPGIPGSASLPVGSTVWRKPLAPRSRICSPEEGGTDITLTVDNRDIYNGLKVSFKPFMFLFLMDTYFPMWLMDGIQIKFELEQPERCIKLSKRYALATTSSVDYSISDAYLQIQSVEYDDTTKNAWESQWRSPEGLLFQMRRYIFEQQIWQATATNFSLPISIEALSIREAYCFIQSEKSVTTNLATTVPSLATQTYDNNAHYYDAGLNYYQFRQGANYFPPAPVFVADAAGVDLCMIEAWNELLETMGAMGMNAQMSIPWSLWLKENPSEEDIALTSLAVNQSRRAIFAANLSAYHGFMGGLYTRNNRTIYIDFLFSDVFYLGTASGSNANRVFNTIFGTDAVLQIQKDSGIIVYG